MRYKCEPNPYGSDASHWVSIYYNCTNFYSFNSNHSTSPSKWIGTDETSSFNVEYKIGSSIKNSFPIYYIVDIVGDITLETFDTS